MPYNETPTIGTIMGIDTIIVAAIAVLLTTLVNRVLTNRKIRTINLEHIEEDDRTFHVSFNYGYEYGMEEGRKVERRERIIANMKNSRA